MRVARRRARTRRTGSGLTTSLRRLHPCRRPGGRRRPRQFRAHRQYTGARGHGSTLVGARDTASHDRRARPQPVRRPPRVDRRARPSATPTCARCWIGGSAATGGYDEHSDLDINVLAAPGTFVRVFDDLLASLVEHVRADQPVAAAGLDVRRRPSALRDVRRRLPALSSAPTRLVDVVVYEATDEHRHVDVRRHGTPLVRFDPDGLVVVRDDDEADLRRGAADRPSTRSVSAAWSPSGW